MAWALNCPADRWDDEHTVLVATSLVRYHGTEAAGTYVRPGPTFRVCSACRSSRELCRCAWRRAEAAP